MEAVKAWLATVGIDASRVKQSQGLNWLQFDATVDEAENLLNTEYNVYEHDASGQPHVACDEYSVPAHLQQHIDFVYPTVHFDAKIKPRQPEAVSKRAATPGERKGLGWPGSGSLPKAGSHDLSGVWSQLENCDEYITPDCLRVLYEFLPNSAAAAKNSYGIVEYSPQAYLPSDLDMFFRNFSSRTVGSRPIFDSIDGGVLQTEVESFDYNGESDLDLEYAMTLVYPQKVTLYQVGDLVEGASFNNFLDAIDASYCTYDGGDDPTQDGKLHSPHTSLGNPD